MKKLEKEISLERARELLGNKEISDEKLARILERIKVFCKIAYKLYLKSVKPNKPTEAKALETEPKNEFKNAA